jgi:hypothetical protein
VQAEVGYFLYVVTHFEQTTDRLMATIVKVKIPDP